MYFFCNQALLSKLWFLHRMKRPPLIRTTEEVKIKLNLLEVGVKCMLFRKDPRFMDILL